MKELGGLPDLDIHNEELMMFFEPILKADFHLAWLYKHKRDGPDKIPMTCFYGTDEKLTEEDILLWKEETIYQLETIELSGNLFFILNHWNTIAQVIKEKINKADL